VTANTTGTLPHPPTVLAYLRENGYPAPSSGLAACLAEARCVTDRVGLPINPPILEVVAELWANGVATTMSCGGHLDTMSPAFVDCGLYRPLVWDQLDPTDKDELDRLVRPWRQANVANEERLAELIAAFESAAPDQRGRLVRDPHGAYGVVCLCAQGTPWREMLGMALDEAPVVSGQKVFGLFVECLADSSQP
jgi:hypothetical protein